MSAAHAETWEEKGFKMEGQIKQWKCRNWTYFGKATVLISLIISNISYIMSVFPTLDHINRKVENLVFSFIWNRMKRKTLIGNTKQGGINMPDFVMQSYAFKVVWMNRLLENDSNLSWIFFFFAKLLLNSLEEMHLC